MLQTNLKSAAPGFVAGNDKVLRKSLRNQAEKLDWSVFGTNQVEQAQDFLGVLLFLGVLVVLGIHTVPTNPSNPTVSR